MIVSGCLFSSLFDKSIHPYLILTRQAHKAKLLYSPLNVEHLTFTYTQGRSLRKGDRGGDPLPGLAGSNHCFSPSSWSCLWSGCSTNRLWRLIFRQIKFGFSISGSESGIFTWIKEISMTNIISCSECNWSKLLAMKNRFKT